MDPDQHRAAIVAEGDLLGAVPASGLGAPVGGCPGWDVARLLGHNGRVLAWAEGVLAAGPDGGDVDAGPRPPEGEAVLGWFQERRDGFLAELDRHDPTERAVGFAGPTTVAFWFRRAAHELAVHRWDAQDAMDPGHAASVEATLAADGVDEWLEVFVPRVLGRTGVPEELAGASIHLHCTDEGGIEGTGEWLLRVTAEGAELERAHGKGDAALRGPASDLLLAVWHRTDLDAVDVVGDAARAEAVLDAIRP